MKVSVIISTYNSPEWLEKVLWGYECQTYKNFEVLIADDGSGEPTKKLIERFITDSPLEIMHVWHEDNGYQKCQILNKAILASNTEYLIFTDGDCIPRADFVSQHVKQVERGYFLSGGAVRLPMHTSKMITREDIVNGKAFDLSWLLRKGLPRRLLKNIKLSSNPILSMVMNKITTAKATWNGGNASGWKQNLLAVNGFDERMEYGGQDRELGERLKNIGLKAKQIRYSGICIHLEHSRGYKNNESIKKNKGIRHETRAGKIIWTPYGIKKEPQPL
jgi:glycosyltransferase involved in cell wall biosynthesis